MTPTYGFPPIRGLSQMAQGAMGLGPRPRAERAERLLGWLLWIALAGVLLWTGT